MNQRRRLLVATTSAHKLGELRTLLDLPATDLVSIADVGLGDPLLDIHTAKPTLEAR